ncbi:sulfatase-like hydrolase/transferase [Enterobacter cloacae]
MIYIQLFALLALTISSYKWIFFKSITTSIIFLLFAFWYISNMFTGYGVTDAVYYQLFNTAQGTSLNDVYSKIEVGLIFLTIVLAILACSVYIKIKKKNLLPLKKTTSLWLLVLISIIPSQFILNIYNSAKDTFFNDGSAAAVKNEYKEINGKLDRKYNYVFIYAESLENTFKSLDGINYTPRLSELANKYMQFTNIRQPLTRGMGWTMAGIVNTQCGIPLVMEQGNSGASFTNFLGKADCIATWFGTQGYQTEFIRGSQKEFAGGDKFLEQHGWQSQHDKNYFAEHALATPDDVSGWGIHDDLLLKHAWDEFSRMSQQKQPFLLSLLTVNTHSPEGTFLKACENHVPKNEQYPMLASVACSDYLLTDFINRITSSPWFKDTIVVLVSDHLMMANNASPLLDKVSQERRNRFIIIKKDVKPTINNTEGTLLDVWPTVLDLSGSVVKELGFGTSLLDNKPGRFIKNYALGRTKDFLAYASQLWNYPSLNDGIKQTNKGIAIGSEEYTLPVFSAIEANGQLKALWFEAFAMNAKKIMQKDNDLFYANLCRNININENGICSYIISRHSIKQIRVNDSGVVSEKIINNNPILYQSDILGLSSAVYTTTSGAMINDRSVNIGYGFNIIKLGSTHEDKASDIDTVLNYSTCDTTTVPDAEITEFLQKQSKPVIFVSNDSAVCADPAPVEKLANILHAPELSTLKFRQQVIGIYKSGHSEIMKGTPDLPFDMFIDTKNYKLITLCEAFMDCH